MTENTSWSAAAPLPGIYPGCQFLDEAGLIVVQAVFPNLDQVCYTQGRGQEFLFLSQADFLKRFAPLQFH